MCVYASPVDQAVRVRFLLISLFQAAWDTRERVNYGSQAFLNPRSHAQLGALTQSQAERFWRQSFRDDLNGRNPPLDRAA